MPHTKSPSIDHLVRWSLTRPLLIPHTACTFTNKDTHILPNSPPWKYTLLWNCDPLQTACSPNVLHEIQYLFHALDNNIPIRAIDIPTPPSMQAARCMLRAHVSFSHCQDDFYYNTRHKTHSGVLMTSPKVSANSPHLFSHPFMVSNNQTPIFRTEALLIHF